METIWEIRWLPDPFGNYTLKVFYNTYINKRTLKTEYRTKEISIQTRDRMREIEFCYEKIETSEKTKKVIQEKCKDKH